MLQMEERSTRARSLTLSSPGLSTSKTAPHRDLNRRDPRRKAYEFGKTLVSPPPLSSRKYHWRIHRLKTKQESVTSLSDFAASLLFRPDSCSRASLASAYCFGTMRVGLAQSGTIKQSTAKLNRSEKTSHLTPSAVVLRRGFVAGKLSEASKRPRPTHLDRFWRSF